MLIRVAAAVCAILVAGCVTMPAPVLIGPDTYMLGLGARGGFSSDADLLALTMRTAGAFCASQRRTLEVQSYSASGVQGWTPQSNQVSFRCVAV
jgi:hypothetical protein